ncbi:glycosyltransferase [Paenibacillus sp. D2_2]|uniref:glycosyltransferase n=1 Tax=Paenibacillus sp. D2_2 TaxID=3073092 RepID=UPI0028162887|nr:glycosyltransferase [Paenibacillus sp. D2_2]WMT40581.1 glycosyltransferase [Paenibacillus sp. D2_2]
MGYAKICILLSTYCGEKFLSEQINSLLMQENVDVHILIRDDGSDDRTKQIISEIADKYPDKLEYIFAQNVG